MIIGRHYFANRNLIPKVVIGALVVLLAAFPLITTDIVTLSTLISSGIWAIAVMGFTLVLRTGQFSMGQAAFMAIGGYVSAILTVRLGIPYWPSFLAAGVVSGLDSIGYRPDCATCGGHIFLNHHNCLRRDSQDCGTELGECYEGGRWNSDPGAGTYNNREF